MDKHTELKKVEFDEFQPNPSTIGFIKLYCEKTKKSKEEIKILDWGCSRGKEVLWLREKLPHLRILIGSQLVRKKIGSRTWL